MSAVWPRVKLGDVLRSVPRPVHVQTDNLYREIGIRSHGKGVFHKNPVSGLELGGKKVFWVEPGDFVLNIVFAWEGAAAVLTDAETGMIGSHRFPTFRADETRLNGHFLLAYFKTPEGLDLLGRVSPGGAGRNRTLSRTAFLQQHIPLPPISEQRRLVTKLEELTRQVKEALKLGREAAIAADALMSSYRRAIFEERPKEHWESLSAFVSSIENGKSPATEGRPATRDEWGVLKTGAVSFGFFDERQNKALPTSFSPPDSLQVRLGDFLMSRANTRELVGACAIVRATRPKLMLSDKTFRFVFREPRRIMPDYLEQALKSPPLREQIEHYASGTSATMKNISKEKVLALRVPFYELPRQQEIVRKLGALQSEVNTLRSLQAETATELDALLPSVLSQAFVGEL